jgi:hypothetical protein
MLSRIAAQGKGILRVSAACKAPQRLVAFKAPSYRFFSMAVESSGDNEDDEDFEEAAGGDDESTSTKVKGPAVTPKERKAHTFKDPEALFNLLRQKEDNVSRLNSSHI